MEISNLSDAEFKTLFIRMLKELSEDFSSIKWILSEDLKQEKELKKWKTQSEMKDTLIEKEQFIGKQQ